MGRSSPNSHGQAVCKITLTTIATRAVHLAQERLDFRALRELLQRNMGRGYFSLDQFEEADMVDTDASKKDDEKTRRDFLETVFTVGFFRNS